MTDEQPIPEGLRLELPQPEHEISIPDFAASLGGKVVDRSETGNPIIKDKWGRTIEVNPTEMAKGVGFDFAKTKVIYNNADQPLDENALSFDAGYKMAMAETPKNQLRFLQGVYGENNVKQIGQQDFAIKDGNYWKKAYPGFLSSMKADSQPIQGGVGGAMMGSLIPIPGASLFGMSAGAVAGKMQKIEDAIQMGLQTEQDAKDFKEHLGQEFGGEVVKNALTMGLLKVGGMALNKASSTVAGYIDKDAIATWMKDKLPAVPYEDWRTLLDSSESLKSVQGYMKQSLNWFKDRAAGDVSGVDPVRQAGIDLIKGVVEDSERSASASYGARQEILKPVLEKLQTSTQPVKQILADTFKEFGTTIDGEAMPELDQIFNKNARGALQKLWKLSQDATSGETVSWQGLQNTLRQVDSIVKASGGWQGGTKELALRDSVVGALENMRGKISAQLSNAINPLETVVNEKGDEVLARDLFSTMQGSWHNFRKATDKFLPVLKYGDDATVNKVMMKMFGESGQFLEQGFKNIAEASGSDVEQQLSELKNIRAALNIAGTFANKAKDTVGYSKGMFNSVTKMVENMKSTPIDYVEGQNWGSKLSTLVRASDKVDSLKAAPLSQQTFTSLQAIGKQIQYFNSLGGQDKVSLLTNPTLLRQFLGTPEKAVQTLQSTSTALQEKINQVRGVGGK